MAVQAQQQCLPHAFLPHHDLGGHAFFGSGGGGLLLDALGVGGGCAGGIGDAVVFGGDAQQQPRSELTCTGTDAGFVPRKRARVGPASPVLPEYGAQQGMALLPPSFQPGQVFAGDVQSRAVGCGAASTSGRAAVGGGAGCLSQGALSQLYHHDMEIDALVRLEMECMRLGLQELRQRQTRAVVAAAERAAAGRLRVAEAELERARCRNAELEEPLRQLTAEGQAWLGVARSHEAVAAGLRATLDQLLLEQPAAGNLAGSDGDAEDAQSCCFETGAGTGVADADDAVSVRRAAECKSCHGAEACVLLLPCRHLCLCRACEAVATSCPVCAAAKNASLQVLLS